ncbi:MAG TPA: glutamate--cysteine ligase, partial [Devosiaceae bacterium]|nr:glutamate--cysteine ligase [Devosiaceae bacterium]
MSRRAPTCASLPLARTVSSPVSVASKASNEPVHSRDDLVAALENGCKPRSEWRVGTEHEKFVFFTDSHKPVPHEGENGIGALLKRLGEALGAEPVIEHGNVVGLSTQGQGAVSLEPGGQLELSGVPLATLHETCSETHAHLKTLRHVAEPMGIRFLGIGVAPTWRLDDVPLMPKARYRIMTPYMEKVGTLGTSMMRRTSTVQANLDFSTEPDMVTKMRVALALQPVVTAMFANSPFVDGKPSGFLSYRGRIWLHTDPARTGMLPFVFEDGMGFERYVDYALDVPMYFVIRGGEFIDCTGQSFRDFCAGRLPALPGETPTRADWDNHLSTIFPEVRLKSFLEMRGADCGPWEEICALPAFWTGLLYDQGSLAEAWELVRDWTKAERQALHEAVPKTALATPFRSGTVLNVARQVLPLARAGLDRRNNRNWEDF